MIQPADPLVGEVLTMSNLVYYRITKFFPTSGDVQFGILQDNSLKQQNWGDFQFVKMIASFTKSCRSKITEFQHWDACNILTYPPKKSMFQKPMFFPHIPTFQKNVS